MTCGVLGSRDGVESGCDGVVSTGDKLEPVVDFSAGLFDLGVFAADLAEATGSFSRVRMSSRSSSSLICFVPSAVA